MSESSWFLYQNSQQIGPFDLGQILQMASTNMIAQDAYLFKAGWKDWVPFENCQAELGLEPTTGTGSRLTPRLGRAPRATVNGQIVVHNNGDLIIGQGVNISATGVFVETPKPLFSMGELLSLTCRIDRLPKAFNVKAEVMRYDEHINELRGYGLRFLDLDKTIAARIQDLIDLDNKTDSG